MIERKFFLGFIRLHILHHAKYESIFGLWMIEELKRHGYSVSPGTMYPILHNLEADGYLKSTKKKVNGKIRKYYNITESGSEMLVDGIKKAQELLKELVQ
jgi:DNA-binding PadR family transcriptional regulator